jgi:hypothetical protein
MYRNMSLSIKRKNPITLSLSLSLSLTQLCLSIKSENVVRFLPNPCVLIGSAAKQGRKALSLSLSHTIISPSQTHCQGGFFAGALYYVIHHAIIKTTLANPLMPS